MKSVLNRGMVMLIAMLMLGVACSVPDEDPSTAWRLDMEIGETVEVNERLEAYVSAIVDNRCPIDIECPDPGVASASITLRTNDGNFNYQINNTDQLEDTAGNYKVTYMLIRPQPDTRLSAPPTKFVRFQIDELE